MTIGDRPAARACCCPGVDAMKTALPENEAERLNALRRYQILDTPPEPAFDRIAEMAASFFRVPMAGISLVDEGRVYMRTPRGPHSRASAATSSVRIHMLSRPHRSGPGQSSPPLTMREVAWTTTAPSGTG